MSKKQVRFKDLIQEEKNRVILNSFWGSYKNGDINKQDLKVKLNSLFNINWTFETYSRYLNVFEVCQDIYEKDNVANEIQKVVSSHKTVSNSKKIRHIARQNIIADEIKNYFENQKPTKIKIHPNYKTNFPDSDGPIDVYLADFHWRNDNDDYGTMHNLKKKLLKFRNKKMNIYLMGDLVQGVLRIDDLYAGSIDPIKQVLAFSKSFCNMISDFSINKLTILKGNHDELRLLNHKGIENPHISDVARVFIDAKLGIKSVVCEEVETETAIILHGHQFGGKKAIEREFKGNSKLLIHAHYHHFYINENIIGLPALCGRSSFERRLALNSKKGFFVMEKNKMEVVYV